MFKVLGERIVTFQIRGAARSKSGLILANHGYMDYLDCCPVWIAQIGPDSELHEEGFEEGSVGLIHDHMELENIPSIWDECRDDPKFKLLREKVEELDAYVQTSIIHGSSILAKLNICEPGDEGAERVRFGSGETGEFYVRD